MQTTLLSFFLVILTGALFRRFWVGQETADTIRKSINTMVLNLFLPALCLKTIYTATLDRTIFVIPLTAALTIIAMLSFSLIVFNLLERRQLLSPSQKGVLILSSSFGNVTYLGIPVLSSLFGTEAIKYALYYDLLATTPILWLIGAPIAARLGAKNRTLTPKDSLAIILKLPPLWGIFFGIILNILKAPLPEIILKVLDMFSGLVVPLMIFSIGLALSLSVARQFHLVFPVILLKLLLSPLLSVFIAKGLHLEGTAFKAVILEGAMPTMVLSLLLAAEFELDVSLSAFAILVTTLLSFITLPLVYHWLA